ncbi:methyltransferase [Streptomyces klenkii]|uniref:methyltransferase n=1 Tax=Streptomyces klenkii TaxID=1420899 RepID=UPI0036E7CC3D
MTAERTHDDQDRAGAEATVNDILQGAWKARAIHVAVELGLPALLQDGPRTVADLAAAAGAHEPTLRRLLRLLAASGIFEEVGHDDLYGHNALSEVLLPDPTSPVATDARFQAAPWHWRAWERLAHSVRTGEASFDVANGVSFWQLTQQDPQARELFNHAMGSVSLAESRQVAEAYDFSGADTVVDIGGGRGSLMAALLESAPGARGVLLERPEVAGEARALLESRGVGERCEVLPGDFFETIPAGADLYLIKHVLHDWDDEDVLRILRRIAAAMAPGSRLLVIDNLIDERPAASTLFVDLLLLVLVGGAERSESDFATLLEKAGLTVERSLPCGSGPLRIVEIRRA